MRRNYSFFIKFMRFGLLPAFGCAIYFSVIVTDSIAAQGQDRSKPLPKIHVAKDGRTFVTQDGRPYVPFGVNYYRPGTGWAPQVWKQFDAEATRKDFVRMKE